MSAQCGLGKVGCMINLRTDPICPGWWLCVSAEFRDLRLFAMAFEPSFKRYLRATMITLADWSMSAERDSDYLTSKLEGHST